MGRVSNSWRRWSLPQRVSGWQPDGRQATSNPPNRAAAGNPSKQDLFPCRLMRVLSATLSPSKADRYTLRSCSVEDGYSSVQEQQKPEAGWCPKADLPSSAQAVFCPTHYYSTHHHHQSSIPDHPPWVTSTSEN